MPKRRMISVVACTLFVVLASRSSAAPPADGFVAVEEGLGLQYRVIGQGRDTGMPPFGPVPGHLSLLSLIKILLDYSR